MMFKKFFKNSDGLTAVEYGLMAALIVIVIIISVKTIGGNLNSKFNAVGISLT